MNKETFLFGMKQQLQTQFSYTEGLACRLAYEAIENQQFNKIKQIDQELFNLASSREIREGNKKMGRLLIQVTKQLYPFDSLKLYENKITANELHGHTAIIFAIVSTELEIELERTLSFYLFAIISSLVQNGLGGIPLKQVDGKKILHELQPFIQEQVEMILHLPEEEFGGSLPCLENAHLMKNSLRYAY
ncbi:urease accessory UreF family protein [Psychrobacillus sp. PGGUH221]|uniref:urease accessory protein UreF n=1 Tax=Psychrobacillus sp. PGGUH221 TaxID=3020058 RepID=UPI0035C71EF2